MRISVSMKKITIHIVNAATTRLSDEEPDLLEQDDNDGVTADNCEGFLLWTPEDIIDIHRLIDERLGDAEKEILCAYIEGFTYIDLGVTEKYWRYHFNKGIEKIRKELGLCMIP